MSSRSTKVVDLGTNRKRLCGFLLVFNSNLDRILHRFRDTAAYRSKNRKNRPFEPTPFSQIALARNDPFRIFSTSHTSPAACITALSGGEEIMTLALSVWIQYQLKRTDGQTASQTRRSRKDPLCSHSVARVKINELQVKHVLAHLCHFHLSPKASHSL